MAFKLYSVKFCDSSSSSTEVWKERKRGFWQLINHSSLLIYRTRRRTAIWQQRNCIMLFHFIPWFAHSFQGNTIIRSLTTWWRNGRKLDSIEVLFNSSNCQIQGMGIDRIPAIDQGKLWSKALSPSWPSIIWLACCCFGPTSHARKQPSALFRGVDQGTLWSMGLSSTWPLVAKLQCCCHQPRNLPLLSSAKLTGLSPPVPLGITTFAASYFCSASKPTAVQSPWPLTTSDQGLCYKWSRLGVVLQQQQGGCFLLDMPIWKERRGRSRNMFLFLIHGVFTIISYFFLLTAISR